jgi:hypothetical protein
MPAFGSRKGYQFTAALRGGKAAWINGIGEKTKQFFPGTLAAETIWRTIAIMWFGGLTVLCWTALSSPAVIVETRPLEAAAAQGPEALRADHRDQVVQGLKAHLLHLRDPAALVAQEEADHPYTLHLTAS